MFRLTPGDTSSIDKDGDDGTFVKIHIANTFDLTEF